MKRLLAFAALLLCAACSRSGSPSPAFQLDGTAASARLVVFGIADPTARDENASNIAMGAFLVFAQPDFPTVCNGSPDSILDVTFGPPGALTPMRANCACPPHSADVCYAMDQYSSGTNAVFGSLSKGYHPLYELTIRDRASGTALVQRAPVVMPAWFDLSFSPAYTQVGGEVSLLWTPRDQPYTKADVHAAWANDLTHGIDRLGSVDDGWEPLPRDLFLTGGDLKAWVSRKTQQPPPTPGLTIATELAIVAYASAPP